MWRQGEREPRHPRVAPQQREQTLMTTHLIRPRADIATDIHPSSVSPMTKAPMAKMPNAVVGASADAAVSAMKTAPATMRKPMGSTVMFDACSTRRGGR